MKIREIILSKYKRFQSLTIDLGDNPKRIVALDIKIFITTRLNKTLRIILKMYLYNS